MGRTAGKFGIGISGRGGQTSGLNGSLISLLKQFTASVDFASIAAGAEEQKDVTVTGITTDDQVIGVEPQAALTAGLIIAWARVKAANTVTICMNNNTAGAIDLAATNFKILTARIAAADQ